ncbi:MAG TPA: four-carbon acid sugar kinase family protein [Chitinophagaceae bacterium]|nr:four-carbon acid sugar kinase family protein [Chitinophagaceae bacterium]
MIAVIADDFTGAAELGGIGLRYGLLVEISTVVPAATGADLLVIAADTRSMDEVKAVIEMEAITKALLPLQPTLVFKKTDSVLRGHIVAETIAQLRILQLPRALLVAANPALGRTIQNGIYFLHGQPIHLSSFSIDPEFAITSSHVYDMLRAGTDQVQVRKATDALPAEGIIAGEVNNTAEVKAWAGRMEENMLPAGGSGFFTAILDTLKIRGSTHTHTDMPGGPALFVCGTTFQKSRDAIQKISDAGGPVSYMPESIATVTNDAGLTYDGWRHEVAAMMQANGKAIIAIRQAYGAGVIAPAAVLRQRMAVLVQMVLEVVSIKDLFIEGGSTAYAVLQRAGFAGFFPVEEMAAGVIRMRVLHKPGLYITVKPGSYDWPPSAWTFG